MPRSRNYHDDLIRSLKDHDEAVAYLNAALEESLNGDEESQEVLLKALRNIAEAQGGLGHLAKKIRIRRENLYRILSADGNPEFKTFTSILSGLGFSLQVA